MGSRIAVMREGKIQQLGTPLEVYDRPANVFVAQFIGTPPMNLFRASVVDSTLRTPSFTLPVPSAIEQGRDVIVGIRPEHLGHGDATIDAKVDMVEPIGHESIVYATAGSEKIVAIYDPHDAPRAGETIAMGVEVAKMHIFDAATENALV